jgi:NAD(P)-dependent dehydrogenase (short-subunit alcohol dehydrogenase family)
MARALVTGGGRGIGAGIARALAAEGWEVTVAARSLDQVEGVAAEIGGTALALDVADPASVERAFAQAGELELLVANAGTTVPSDVSSWELDPNEWWHVFEVNVRGVHLCCRAVIPGMASSWIVARPTKATGRYKGKLRYRVVYRMAGAGSPHHYGGSFATKAEALERKRWIDGELAARRVPALRPLEATLAPTVRQACDTWRSSRVDVTEATQVLHRVALSRVLPVLGEMRVDEVGEMDVVRLVETLAARGKKRETIRKSVKYLAAVLDDHGRDPTPARSRRVRLPHEEGEELEPPLAAHVEAVYGLLARPYRLPLLWLDWSGARVASVDLLRVGDYDERGRRVRLRASTTKTRAALWVELHPALADALEATLPPREDRDLSTPLFPDVTADRLRTAIARACKAAGVPLFSPHDLRHRRISLLHAQGRSWAEIARFVGQKKLSITADTYTHVISDGREADYGGCLSLSIASSSKSAAVGAVSGSLGAQTLARRS